MVFSFNGFIFKLNNIINNFIRWFYLNKKIKSLGGHLPIRQYSEHLFTYALGNKMDTNTLKVHAYIFKSPL